LTFLHSDEFSQIKVAGEWGFFNKLLMAVGRKLSPERLAETAQAGLKEVFEKKTRA